MITHALDMEIVNSWLKYKKQVQLLGVQENKILGLWVFRISIGQYLILHKDPPKKGRPLGQENNNRQESKKVKIEARPYNELRYDKYEHSPNIDEKTENTRCKMENLTHFAQNLMFTYVSLATVTVF